MSLLGGFDVTTEISRASVLKLIKSKMKLGGIPLNPPFEIGLPISGGGIVGNVHMIVDDLLLNLDQDDSATLTLNFSNTSLIAQAPALTITALDGTATIQVPLSLVQSNQTQMAPAANLGAAAVTIDFTQAAKTKIGSGFAGTGVTVNQFTASAQSQITQVVQQQGSQTLGQGFTVVPGSNGSLLPLQYERLEMHCISPNATNQALGLFGILLVANHSHGNAAQKTAPAIIAGQDICVSIAPGAFHSLNFCPALANQLGVQLPKLPTSCGSSSGLDTQGVTLTKLTDSFASGHISVDGTAKKSGFCYEADVKFHGELTFSVSGTTLTPNLAMDQPEVDVSIDWYCGPAGGIAIGLTAVINSAIVNAIVQGIADDYAQGALNSILGNKLPSQSIGGITGVTFDQVSITTEGLTLNGLASIPLGPTKAKGLALTGSVTTSSKEALSTGNYVAILPLCPPTEFPFTEYAQQQTATYQAVPSLLGLPLTLEWWLLAGDGVTKIALPGTSGSVSFTAQTFYALPLPAGIYMNQTVNIAYSKSGDTIHLMNTPSEGNYMFALYAKATDPVGNSVQILTPGTYVAFEGNAVTIGGGYQEWAADCMAKWGAFLRHYRPQADLTFTPWVPVNYPSPEEFISYIRTIVASGDPRADEVLGQVKLAHGSSFYRALFSPAAGAAGLTKKQITAVK